MPDRVNKATTWGIQEPYDVDQVRPASSTVLELPDLNGPTLWLCPNTLCGIVPSNIVDLPLTIVMLEFEVTVRDSLVRREVDRTEWIFD